MRERDRPVRPLALLPRFCENETFGSWLRRAALAYRFLDAHSFAGQLLADAGEEELSPQCDLDVAPPQRLLSVLALRSSYSVETLTSHVVPRARDVLPPGMRDAYCPVCFFEDRELGRPYLRRSWLSAWTISCPVHGCLMGEYRETSVSKAALVDRLLDSSAKLKVPCEVRAVMIPSPARQARRSRWKVMVAEGKWIHALPMDDPLVRRLFLRLGAEESDRLYFSLFGRNRRSFQYLAETGATAEAPIGSVRARIATAHFVATAMYELGRTRSVRTFRLLLAADWTALLRSANFTDLRPH